MKGGRRGGLAFPSGFTGTRAGVIASRSFRVPFRPDRRALRADSVASGGRRHCSAAIAGLAVAVCMSISCPVFAQTRGEPNLSDLLVKAIEAGDAAEARRLVERGAHKPNTANGFRAFAAAKNGGHREIVDILEEGIREYVDSGALYRGIIDNTLKRLRKRAEANPDSVNWTLAKRMLLRTTAAFYEVGKDSGNPMHPVARHFDEAEFERRVDEAFDALQVETRTRRRVPQR